MKKLLSLIFVFGAVGGMHFAITTESLLHTELTTLALVQNWMTSLVTKGKPGNSQYINYNTLKDEASSAIKNLSPQQKINLIKKASNAKTILTGETDLILNIKAGLDAIAALCNPEGEALGEDDAAGSVEGADDHDATQQEDLPGSSASGEEDLNLEEGAPESLVPEDASSSPEHLENGDGHYDGLPLFYEVFESGLIVSPVDNSEVVPAIGVATQPEEPVTPAPVIDLPYKIPHKDTGRSELTQENAAKKIQAVIRARKSVSKPAKTDKPRFRAQKETLHETKVSCTLKPSAKDAPDTTPKPPVPAQNHNVRNALVVTGTVLAAFVALAAYLKRSTITSWFKKTSSTEEPIAAPDAALLDLTEPANSEPSADVKPATAEQPATPAENADSTPANSEAQPIA